MKNQHQESAADPGNREKPLSPELLRRLRQVEIESALRNNTLPLRRLAIWLTAALVTALVLVALWFVLRNMGR